MYIGLQSEVVNKQIQHTISSFFSLTTPEAPHMSERLLTLFVTFNIVVEFSK